MIPSTSQCNKVLHYIALHLIVVVSLLHIQKMMYRGTYCIFLTVISCCFHFPHLLFPHQENRESPTAGTWVWRWYEGVPLGVDPYEQQGAQGNDQLHVAMTNPDRGGKRMIRFGYQIRIYSLFCIFAKLQLMYTYVHSMCIIISFHFHGLMIVAITTRLNSQSPLKVRLLLNC